MRVLKVLGALLAAVLLLAVPAMAQDGGSGAASPVSECPSESEAPATVAAPVRDGKTAPPTPAPSEEPSTDPCAPSPPPMEEPPADPLAPLLDMIFGAVG
jgi:hypothetical protein